jgi:glutamine synthetase
MALPATLGHALEAFEQSDLARRVLGEHVFQCYLAGKRREWDEFRTTVTDWELRKYLKLY